jgi:hypothetical protein
MAPNHALQRTGTVRRCRTVNRPLSMVSLGIQKLRVALRILTLKLTLSLRRVRLQALISEPLFIPFVL